MTQQEQQQLSAIVDRLIDAQNIAPDNVVIKKGRSTASVSYTLLEIIRDMKEVIGYEPTGTEEKPETETA